jgi:hypothetical protein
MTAEQIYHLLQQKPFRPVRVYLKDGRTYDIPVRQLAVVGVTFLDVSLQAPDQEPGICGKTFTIPLQDIDRLEPLILTETAR